MTPPLVDKMRRKSPRGVHPEKLGGGVRHASWNPYPISDQNLWFSQPCFRPDHKFDTLFHTWSPKARRETRKRVTNCCGTYTVGVNIKREVVLSPNQEVAASSKNIPNSRIECTNHTLFQTKMVKIDTLFQTKTAKETYPLAPHILI